MATSNRPLSPHLQIYKLPLPAIMSITSRATGVFLTFGTLLLSCWIISLASGSSQFASTSDFISSWFGLLLLLGWTYSIFYHLLNGVRHLYWDMGKGFEMKSVYTSGYITIIGSAILTLVVWVIGYSA